MSNDELYRAAYLIGEHKTWFEWKYNGEGYTAQVDNLGQVDVFEVKADNRDDDWYGGEYPMGSTAQVGIVFRVVFPDDSVRFYFKEGSSDSYGDWTWNGSFYEIEQVKVATHEWKRV